MRWAAVALAVLAGVLVAPAGAAGFPDAMFGNQCQYSYDRYWRPVPMIFGGRLVDGSGAEAVSPLAVGDTVRLVDGTVTAVLPSWLTTFAYEAGMIPVGDGSLPVRAWLALEATNTAEGVTAPIALNTVADTHVELTPAGLVDEQRSTIAVRNAAVPPVTWTATGGEVAVRQAVGESLPPLAVRDGAAVRVTGSLFVEATLTFPSGDVFRLYLDCLQGEQVDQGATHTDALPGAVGTFAVPGWTGSLGGTPVDADFLAGGGPPRAGAGEQALVRGASLRLRLTDAQRDAWFGDATNVSLAGSLDLFGERSVEGSQTVGVAGAFAVPADGPVTLVLPLPDSAWTAAGGDGVDVRSGSVLALDATAGTTTRRLILTRISAGEAYPFARVLRPAPAPPPPISRGQSPPPVTKTVMPVVVAKPVLTVRSTRLKVSGSRVSVALGCAEAACRGTLSLRVGAKTLTKTARYSLAAGKRATVRLTLSSAGRRYLREHKRVSSRLTVRPSGAAAVTKRLTLTR